MINNKPFTITYYSQQVIKKRSQEMLYGQISADIGSVKMDVC